MQNMKCQWHTLFLTVSLRASSSAWGWMPWVCIWLPWSLVRMTWSGGSSELLVIWGTTLAVCRVSMPFGAGTAVSVSFCWHEESATSSARSSNSFDVDLLSLLGRGIDRNFRVLTCGLLWSQLRAISL